MQNPCDPLPSPSAILSLLCLSLIGLVTAPASAADLVVFEDGLDDGQIAAGAAALQSANFQARPVSELAAAWSPLILLGGGSATPCFGTLDGFAGLQRRLADATEALDSLETVETNHLLDSARAALPCAEDFLSPQSLSDLFFLEGVMSTYAGQKKDAMMHFCESAAIHPERSFDESYPPDAQTLFDAGVAIATTVKWATVSFEVADLNLEELRLDGVSVPAWDPHRSVVPGYHVVQWRGNDGRVGTVAFGIGEGVRTTLGTSGVLARAMLAGPGTDSSPTEAARTRLREAGELAGVERVLVLGSHGASALALPSGEWILQEVAAPPPARASQPGGRGRPMRR